MFSVDREELAFWLTQVVNFLSVVTKHEEPVFEEPVFKAVHLVPAEDGDLRMRCCTPHLLFSVGGFEAKGDLKEFAVNAEDLKHIAVKGGSSDTTIADVVTFEVEEDFVLVVAGDFTTKLELIDYAKEIAPPDEKDVLHGEVEIEAFGNALEAVIPFLSKASARPELMVVFLSGNSLYAATGEQGALFHLEGFDFPKEGLSFVPQPIFQLLKSAETQEEDKPPRKVKVFSTSEWVIFEGGPFILYLRRFIGVYSVDVFEEMLSLGKANKDKINISYASLHLGLERVRYFTDAGKLCVLRIDRKEPYLAALYGIQHKSKSYLSAGTLTGKQYDMLIPVEVIAAFLKVKMEKIELYFSTEDVDISVTPPLIGGVAYFEYEKLQYWMLPTAK